MKTMKNTTDYNREEKLTNATGYGMLRAIVKYYPVDDHIKGRAKFYLSDKEDLSWKLTHKSGEGSFFFHVLLGDLEGAISRGCQALKKAITTAIVNNEI